MSYLQSSDSPDFEFYLEEAPNCQGSKQYASTSTMYGHPCTTGRKASFDEYALGHWNLETYQFPPPANAPSSIADVGLSHDLQYNMSSQYMAPQWNPDFVGSVDCGITGDMAFPDYHGSCHTNYSYGEPYWSSSHLGVDTLPSSRRSSSASDISSSSSSSSYSQFVQVSPVQSKARPDSPASSDSSTQTARRRFPCLLPECGRRFTSQYTLKVHMEAHKPKPRVSFPCTLGCSERFSRQHDRLRHEVAKHNKICEFLCDECGRFFSTQKTLSNHKCPMAQGGTRWIHTN